MTVQVDVRPVESTALRVRSTPSTVVGLAVLAALLRLPFLTGPLSADESGFLYVAAHWGRTGGSLYGPYWVDRPPLLLALFSVADALPGTLGGTVGLRLLGCLAAAVSVAALGLAAQRVLGPRGARWTAAVACAALTAPVLGSVNVNGELLATPFVCLGVLAWVGVARADHLHQRAALAFAAGLSGAAAVLVKQNVVDVFVFAVLLTLASRRSGRRWSELGRHLIHLALGAAAMVVVVLGLAATRGTSPGGVFFAMYPFRIQAAGLMGHAPLTDRIAHLETMAGAWAASGAPLLLLALIVLVARHRVRQGSMVRPLAVAVIGLAAYDMFSVAAGGSYWIHYLVQLAPVTALAAGLLAASARWGRMLTAGVLVVVALSWAVALPHRTSVPGTAIGQALGTASRPGDSVVSLMGSADVVQSSGLGSPYRYLWSLPSRTLDPGWRLLADTLASPRAPTWVVVRGSKTLAELGASAPGPVLAARYQQVAVVCGRPVYLRHGLDRPAPVATDCRRPLAPWFGGDR